MILAEEKAWVNSQLSVARHFGGLRINGQQFCVMRNGDLLNMDFYKYYNKLGAERFKEILDEHRDGTEKELRVIYEKEYKQNKTKKK